jgi:hypothetical protein
MRSTQDEPCKLEASTLVEAMGRCSVLLGTIAAELGLGAPAPPVEPKRDEDTPFLRVCLDNQLGNLRYMERFLDHIWCEVKELRLLALGNEAEKKH